MREVHRTRTEMVAADLVGRRGLGLTHVRVADDREVVAVLLERRERRGREIVRLPRGRGRPEVHLGAPLVAAGGAVHHLDGHEARCLLGVAERAASDRNHRVEIRQGDRGTHPLQELTAGHGLSGQEIHRSVSVGLSKGDQRPRLDAGALGSVLAGLETGAALVGFSATTFRMRNASLRTTPKMKSLRR